MAYIPVRDYFRSYGLEGRITRFDHDSETVQETAQLINKPLGQIAKAIAFKVEDHYIMVVCSSDDRISEKKFEAKFHAPVAMMPDDQVEAHLGHQIGGVCPFLLPDDVEVYLDMSLRRYPVVYPAAGSKDTVIALTLDELAKHSNAKSWAYLCVGNDDFGRSKYPPSYYTDGSGTEPVLQETTS